MLWISWNMHQQKPTNSYCFVYNFRILWYNKNPALSLYLFQMCKVYKDFSHLKKKKEIFPDILFLKSRTKFLIWFNLIFSDFNNSDPIFSNIKILFINRIINSKSQIY